MQGWQARQQGRGRDIILGRAGRLVVRCDADLPGPPQGTNMDELIENCKVLSLAIGTEAVYYMTEGQLKK